MRAGIHTYAVSNTIFLGKHHRILSFFLSSYARYFGRHPNKTFPKEDRQQHKYIFFRFSEQFPRSVDRDAAAREVNKAKDSATSIPRGFRVARLSLPPAAVKWPVSLTAWVGPEALF